ncbi:MAG TPA: HesA/MoeB/ThiF family protein [Candidatus Binataceae bacterium]|nr:HesA/MoeB/ThiF family protein [Candidatus Binataceae bacterium]
MGRVLIIGVGGLGVPAAMALARSGAASLTLADAEAVELSNLARQVIYRTSDIGQPKVRAAARRLQSGFPGSAIECIEQEISADNAEQIIAAHDFVIDGTDNPEVKFLINDVCIATRKPFTYGGVLGLRGQAMTVIPGRTACLRCLFEEPPLDAEIASCRDAGILGPIAAAIGGIQAAEAIAFISGATPELAGRMLTYDATGISRIRVTTVKPRPGCACGAAIIAQRVAG